MDESRFPHLNTIPHLGFMNEVFGYDVRHLESTEAYVISKYVVGLSQYLVYLNSEMNRLKGIVLQKRRFLDNSVNQHLTKEILKEYTAKKDAASFVIASSPELITAQEEMEDAQDQLYLLEGSDKSLAELVAAFKRELTRREHERQFSSKQ